MKQKIKVGIYQFNPHTAWKRGGGEMHAGKYVDLLPMNDVDVAHFIPHQPEKFDVLHLFGANYQMNEIGKYAQKEGIKVVTTPILFPSENTLKYRAFLALDKWMPFSSTLTLRKELLENCDAIISNSEPESKYIAKSYSVDYNKITTLGTGVDASFLSYNFSETDLPKELEDFKDYVLMVGRVTPLKGQLQVLESLKNENIKVLLVGQPDAYETKYEKDIAQLVANNSQFKWIKGLPGGGNQIKAVYANALCHVLFSDTDVAPLVNIEAASLGTVVISKPHITVNAIMDDAAIYAATTDQLKQSILKVANFSPEERTTQVKRLQDLVAKKYTWEQIVKDSVAVYREILDKK